MEMRLEELGVDHLTIGGFIGHYNAASDADRRLIRVMGDRALIRFVRGLPAAQHDREDAALDELHAQAAEIVGSRSVKDVLAWVGDDRQRAELAHAAEHDGGRPPRSTLVDALEELLTSQP